MKRLITTVLVAGVLCACGGVQHENAALRSVELTKPAPMEATRMKCYPGIIREAHTIGLGFKTAGQIERICVKEGDYVRQGQLLAELDAADYRLGVEALQIQ